MTDDLQRLVERIEGAGKGSQELDREIMLAVGYRYEERDIGCRYEDGTVALDWVYVDSKTDKWRSTHPLEFTTSIDAAMTLVDPRALWAHGSMEEGPFARLCWPQPDGSFSGGYVEAHCNTVPLSIVCAALRARINQEKSNGR